MNQMLLVVVPCGRGKVWDKHPELRDVKATEAYIGPPFKLNKAFAEKFADRWLILSAKYGFIEPDFSIPEHYDVSFNNLESNPVSLTMLRKQVETKALGVYDVVVALGGKNYTCIVKAAFPCARVIAPAEGLPIGLAMKLVKTLLRLDKEQMINKLMQ